MKFFKYHLLSFAVLLCMVPMMTYAWTQSFSYESAIPDAPVIDVRVFFARYVQEPYVRQFNNLYVNTGTVELSGKAADCLAGIEIARAKSGRWKPLTHLKVTGNAWDTYINRCGNNTLKIQRKLNGSYRLYKKDHKAGYVGQSSEIKI